MKKASLIYWKGSAEIDRNHLSVLERMQGVAPTIVSQFDFSEYGTRQLLPKLVVVDLSGTESESAEKILALQQAPASFLTVPLVIVGNRLIERTENLRRKFAKVHLLSPPSSSHDLERVFMTVLGAGAFESDADDETRDSLLRTDTSEWSYGGRAFAFAQKPDEVPTVSEALNATASARDRTVEIWTQSPTVAARAQRVAICASSMAKAVGLPPEKQTAITQAAFFARGLSGETQEQDGIGEYDPALLSKRSANRLLAQRYSETSVYVAEQLQLPQAADYIMDLSRGFQRLAENKRGEEISMSTGCLIIPELAERAAWHRGRWDRYGLARLMRKLTDGSLFSFPAKLLACFGKMIVEALGGWLLVRPEKRKVYESDLPYSKELLIEAEQEGRGLAANRASESITIEQLRPGMKLLSPLSTEDGVLLLRAGTNLDSKILNCVLKLSAMRPLTSPVLIEKRSEER